MVLYFLNVWRCVCGVLLYVVTDRQPPRCSVDFGDDAMGPCSHAQSIVGRLSRILKFGDLQCYRAASLVLQGLWMKRAEEVH